jgi:hypothetical protein
MGDNARVRNRVKRSTAILEKRYIHTGLFFIIGSTKADVLSSILDEKGANTL